MNILSYALAIALGLSGVTAQAEEDVDCNGELFHGERSLTALPPEIVATLRQKSDLADRGEPFEVGDVVVAAEHLPFRRFSLAAINADHAVASIEHGGGPNFTEVWDFKLIDSHWIGLQKWTIHSVPSSLMEILFVPCNGHEIRIGNPVPPKLYAKFFQDERVTILSIFGSETYQVYKLTFATSGGHKHPQIANHLKNDRPLSLDERSTLRYEAEILKNSIDKNDPAHGVILDFIASLNDSPTKPPR